MLRSDLRELPTPLARRWLVPLLLFLALAALPADLAAHDFWIEPSAFVLDSAAPLAVRLRVGDRHRGEPVPRRDGRIERFSLVGAGGEEAVRGIDGAEPAGLVPALGEGAHWLVYEGRPTPHRLDGAPFERYLEEEGLETVSAQRADRGESRLPGRERFARCAKALVRRLGDADAGSSDEVARSPVGLPLELVPDLDPGRLAAGDALTLRLLFRGRPLAGARVETISAVEPAIGTAARTDSAGRVELPLPRGGRWLVRSVHMERAAEDSGADWESWWASLAFEMPNAD